MTSPVQTVTEQTTTNAALDRMHRGHFRHLPLVDQLAAAQLDALRANCVEHGIVLHDLDSPAQGIVHVIGPEQGLTQPAASRWLRETEQLFRAHLFTRDRMTGMTPTPLGELVLEHGRWGVRRFGRA